MRELEVSHHDLLGSASGLADAAEVLREELRILGDGFAGDGDPWGEGDLVGQIGAAYRHLVGKALARGEAIAERYEAAAEEVAAASRTHRAAQTGAEEVMAALARRHSSSA
ncbi:hypothetical protein ACFYSC_13060 [Streptosporangium sp. NPDC004379]|uniref:hypothetical protein n=1 Tax=Streptosporangium sp. NPDC004379 TaxID=3366189 RepID=UPI0036A36409